VHMGDSMCTFIAMLLWPSSHWCVGRSLSFDFTLAVLSLLAQSFLFFSRAAIVCCALRAISPVWALHAEASAAGVCIYVVVFVMRWKTCCHLKPHGRCVLKLLQPMYVVVCTMRWEVAATSSHTGAA